MQSINEKITGIQSRLDDIYRKLENTCEEVTDELETVDIQLSDLYVAANAKETGRKEPENKVVHMRVTGPAPDSDNVRCPFCGYAFSADNIENYHTKDEEFKWRFCPKCGNPLSEKKKK